MARGALGALLGLLRKSAGRDSDALTDADLVERFARERDAAAFEVLVQRFGPMVFGVCRRILEGVSHSRTRVRSRADRRNSSAVAAGPPRTSPATCSARGRRVVTLWLASRPDEPLLSLALRCAPQCGSFPNSHPTGDRIAYSLSRIRATTAQPPHCHVWPLCIAPGPRCCPCPYRTPARPVAPTRCRYANAASGFSRNCVTCTPNAPGSRWSSPFRMPRHYWRESRRMMHRSGSTSPHHWPQRTPRAPRD
jgi:hypothetical protein